MKISKHVMLWALGFVCVLTVSLYPAVSNAQEGEAVDADMVIMDKMTSPTPPQAQEQMQSTKPGGTSEYEKEQEAVRKVLEEELAKAKAENKDEKILAKKVDLAKKMHQIRPTREQVDSAVQRTALNFPPQERASFIAAMESMLNYNAIERVSVDAMVETYSLKELESMVEYFSKPEARSASKKIPTWARKVQPEIVHMIDRAIMRLRTGQ